MELRVREIPGTFTIATGKTYFGNELFPEYLQALPRNEVKEIAKFLHRYWSAEEINRTWLGQAATKEQFVEFIVTGYIRTASSREEPVWASDVERETKASSAPLDAPKAPGEDSLADIIAQAIQGRIKTAATVSAEQVESAVLEKMLELREYVDAQDSSLASNCQALMNSKLETIETKIAETENSLREEFSSALANARPQQTTVRIEVTGDRQYVLEGKRHECFDDLFLDIVAMMETGNTHKANFWLCGPAGTGKTTAAKMIAEKLGLPFYFNGAIDSEYKLRGFIDAQGRIIYTPFRRAFEFGGVYLFDECDASMPSACLAFNAALANGSYDFPLDSDNELQLPIQRHATNIILAGANTWNGPEGGFVGRMRQDGAFLDRFARIPWTVDESLERSLCTNMDWVDYCQAVRRRIIETGVEHIVSPRCTMGGDALLRAGRPWKRAVETWVRKGLDQADWSKIGGGY